MLAGHRRVGRIVDEAVTIARRAEREAVAPQMQVRGASSHRRLPVRDQASARYLLYAMPGRLLAYLVAPRLVLNRTDAFALHTRA